MLPRTRYLYELDEVQRLLCQLADAVDGMLARALRAFRDNNTGTARDTLRIDDEIDDRCYDLEERVISIIAAQQPVATDLRFLMAAIQVATELERIGDYAHGIATLVIRNSDVPVVPLPEQLSQLVDVVRTMLRDSVAAFIDRDPDAADHFHRIDDKADALFATILNLSLIHI